MKPIFSQTKPELLEVLMRQWIKCVLFLKILTSATVFSPDYPGWYRLKVTVKRDFVHHNLFSTHSSPDLVFVFRLIWFQICWHIQDCWRLPVFSAGNWKTSLHIQHKVKTDWIIPCVEIQLCLSFVVQSRHLQISWKFSVHILYF